MKIAYLKMTNFMLHKKFYKKFKDKDVIGIICEYNGNKSKSNRGGKTTVMEAVKYALHGTSRAKKEIKLIHLGEEFMEVEVGLVDNKGKLYVIRRGRDHKNKGLLECDWLDKKKEAQEAINNLIGCDAKEFELINYFKQSDINRFLFLPEKEQKQHLMKWLDNTHWNKLFKAADIDHKEKKKELAKKKTKRDTILEGLDDVKALEEKVYVIVKKIRKREKKIESLEDDKEELIQRFQVKAEMETLEIHIEDLESEIKHHKELKLTIKSKNRKLQSVLDQKDAMGVDDFDEDLYKQDIYDKSKAQLQIKEDKKKLELMESEFCGICPLLNEGCDRIKKDPKEISKVKKSVKKNVKLINLCSDAIQGWEDLRELQDSITEAKNDILSDKRELKPIKPMKKKLKALKAKYGSLKPMKNASKKIDKVNQVIKTKKKGLDEMNQNLGQYNSRIFHAQKATKKVSKIDKSIKKLEVEVEDLKYLVFMFGKSGIPSQEIENAFGEIESDINLILRKLGTPFEITFNADKELGNKESECAGCGWSYPKGYKKTECNECGEPRKNKRKEALNLTIEENGFESDIEMDSGGGLTFISLALRIALTLLKKRQINSQLDVVFLDEIDSALDDDAREKIMSLVWLLITSLGFKQVFWVSHNKRIKESVPHTLKVTRFRKYAKAKWD